MLSVCPGLKNGLPSFAQVTTLAYLHQGSSSLPSRGGVIKDVEQSQGFFVVVPFAKEATGRREPY